MYGLGAAINTNDPNFGVMTNPNGPVLNCPGDPGCPGYVVPGSSAYQTSLLQQILANQSDQMGYNATGYDPMVPVNSPGAPTWFTANSTLIYAGLAAVVVLGFFGGRRR